MSYRGKKVRRSPTQVVGCTFCVMFRSLHVGGGSLVSSV